MPKLRSPTVHPMTRLLKSYDLNGNNLSGAIHCSPATARKKISNPQFLTMGDMIAIHYKFGVPLDDLRGCIS